MVREFKCDLCLVLVACLLSNAFCAPSPVLQPRRPLHRPYRDAFDEDSHDLTASNSKPSSTSDPFDDDDDDDEFGTMQMTSGGGSSIFSLLNLVSALFPSSGSSGNKDIISRIRHYLQRHQQPVSIRKKDVADNVIEVDYVKNLTPPFQRQEDEDDDSDSESDDESDDDDNSESEESNNAAEVSVEDTKDGKNDKASQQDSKTDNGSEDDHDSDYDEPEGDDGGILGLIGRLSGGGEGSDLGTLLSTVSEIAGNLSGGEGFDLNGLIMSAFGLFFGLLSKGEENPGEVIATYFMTSLDTITGGGAQNNGAFIGRFISTLLKGISAGSSSGQSSEHPVSPLWTLKMDLLRAFLQFATSILGLASSSSTNAFTL